MNGSTIPSILVVDDSPLNIDVLLEILGDDYDVSVANIPVPISSV